MPKPTPHRNAAQAARSFYANPAVRAAAQAARYGAPGAGITIVPVAASAQVRAVGAGRKVRALPTPAVRTIKRRVRRTRRRLVGALAVIGVALLVLVFLIPLAAAVSAALVLGALYLAHAK